MKKIGFRTAPKFYIFNAFMLICLAFPLKLNSQDNIPPPPAGYDSYKATVPHGKTEVVSYYSSTVGKNRQTRIYLPAGYTKDSSYNVLYLLHGIGGDINEWYNNGSPNLILDNLNATGTIAPMIVVLPNGRAMEDDSPGSDIFAADKVAGFANFEFELINDLIPFIDTTYSVKPGREARAIAGLSMGGGQALNFGLAHLDTFAWVGAFSPAPNTKAANQFFPNIEEDTAKLLALWISCGGADNLLYISENTHNFMTDNEIEHYYLIQAGKGHDWSVWKPGLYYFTQRIFGNVPVIDTTSTTKPSALNNQKPDAPGIYYSSASQLLHLQNEHSIQNLYIYDLHGKVSLTKSYITSNSVDISGLRNGIYFVSVESGNHRIYSKFVKY